MNNEPLTHMPFLIYDKEGRRIVFFAKADEAEPQSWKLYYCIDNGEQIRLETKMTHGKTECSPTAWQDENGWHVSFIAMDENDIYRLYRMDGQELVTLSQPIALRIARTGFVYQDRLVVGEIQDLVHVHDSSGDHTIELPGTFIYRVSYRADAPDQLLISGDWIGENEEPFTLEYNLQNNSQRFIECDGHGAYKCSIYGNEILFAEKWGDCFESRRIKQSPQFSGVCCQMAHRHEDAVSQSQIKVTKKCGCRRNEKERLNENPVRPSCLECVEKHLGAALVIASEIYDGYTYKLRFIGHLHEAEEESQEFLSLHKMIREARKDYQKGGKSPDWEILAKLISDAKNDC
jgi:hypothetical protein